MKKLLVVDGNSILNRQFYGSRPLTTKSGIPTNATLGFVKVLLSQLEGYKPDFCAVAFDLKAPTFRHLKYELYKAGRHATPEELLAQFSYTKDFIRALGISVVELPGYEADDILGTLSLMAENEGYITRILTGDKDSFQLISEKSEVLYASSGEYKNMGVEEFYERYGIAPDKFVEVKALMGDSSDNIPGVAGIGEKTALKLIKDYSSLEGVYEWAEEEYKKPKVSSTVKKLVEGKENAFLSRELSEIYRKAPLEISPSLDEIRLRGYDYPSLRNIITALEFTSLEAKLLTQPEESPSSETKDTASEKKEPEELDRKELLQLDFSSPVAFCEENDTVYLFDGERSVKGSLSLEEVKELFEKGYSFVVYDMKSLMHRLCELSVDVEKCDFCYDVMLASYVISPSEGASSLERLISIYLKEEAFASPAEALYKLYRATERELRETKTESIYRDIEYPLAKTLFRMEREGFMVDISALCEFSRYLDKSIEESTEKIYALAGKEFNIGSPKQLGEVLFETLGLPAKKKTKTGYSTSAEVLEELSPYHPIIEHILNYRQVTKLKSTYADGLLKVADENGRVHTTFTQTVTATGRLSSVEPNLQNIPVRTHLGREMRRCFVAEKGKVLIDADYSQIELRILAAISGDATMMSAFKRGIDVHTQVASQVFGVPEDEVTSEMRKRAKAVNFGIVYGIGEYSLSKDLHIPISSASEYIRNYKEKYSGIAYYLKEAVENARKYGYVTTLLGRRRMIPEISSPKANIRNFGERVAMNSPIQGTAADIIKIAMLKVEKALYENGLSARLILQVHDELIVEADERDAEMAKEILVREMENALLLEVPLTVGVSIGRTWYECK